MAVTLLAMALVAAQRAAAAPSLPVVSFAPCPSAPAPAYSWTFTGAPSQAGTLAWGGNASLCLVPRACSSADGAPAALAPCAGAAACSSWAYDTYTSFTLTNVAAGTLLTSSGAGGANATVAAASSTSNQQFVIQDQAVSPASDTTLCLAAGAAA
jgi:hypothetical protein